MLEGIIRESTSKQATKQLKKDGYLIANIYGGDLKENINAAFKKNDFIRYVRNKDTLKFTVKVGSNEIPVVIQDYQKHPLTSDLAHVDLRAATGDKEAAYLVPVNAVGTPVGMKNKGVLITNVRRIKVKCKPADLPNEFVLKVDDLDVGDNILVRDIEVPENVKIVTEGRVAVLSVIKAK
jgi:large subunit ribosomal protein L25